MIEEIWDEVFITGTHTDAAGNTRQWTEKDLDKIVEMSNASEHEAPIVIGHPKTNDPAFGWVEKIKRVGNKLFAKYKDIVPEFKEWVNNKIYKKKSIALYNDMSLRHVGYLGAQPPAIKGLSDLSFGDEKNITVIEFAEESPDKKARNERSEKYSIGVKEGGHVTKPSEYDGLSDNQFADPVNYRYPIDKEHIKAALSYWGMPENREQYSEAEVKVVTRRMLDAAKNNDIEIDEDKWKFIETDKIKFQSIRRLFSGLRDLLIEKFGVETVDQTVNKYDLEYITKDDNHFTEPSKKENRMSDEVKDLKQRIEDMEKQHKELQTKFSEEETKRKAAENKLTNSESEKRKAENTAFAEELIKDGVLKPGKKETVLQFMESLHGAGEYEFAEGVKKPAVQAFKEFLKDELPKKIEFGEKATKDGAPQNTAGKAAKQLDDLTKKKMADRKDLTYSAAFAEVQDENPQLTMEYMGEIGGK